MTETAKKQEKPSEPWHHVVTGAVVSAIGWMTAHWTINSAAKKTFEERGLLQGAEAKARQVLGGFTPDELLKSIKSAVHDSEYGSSYPGAISHAEAVYSQAVKEVFAEHKASGLVGKFRHALTPNQQWKTAAITIGAMVAASTLNMWAFRTKAPAENDEQHIAK